MVVESAKVKYSVGSLIGMQFLQRTPSPQQYYSSGFVSSKTESLSQGHLVSGSALQDLAALPRSERATTHLHAHQMQVWRLDVAA